MRQTWRSRNFRSLSGATNMLKTIKSYTYILLALVAIYTLAHLNSVMDPDEPQQICMSLSLLDDPDNP